LGEIRFDVLNARVTFKNVPLHTLSKFTFKDVDTACAEFKKIDGVDECIIIQTASRVEIFTVSNVETDDSPDARRAEGKTLVLNQIKDTWVSLSSLEQIDIDHFDQTLEVYKGDDVYLHLLRLASGLDSVVVGKQEVFDEIVQSIERAKAAGVSGNILNKLFDSVIRLAIRMRDTTGIAKDVISLGDVAVKLVDEKAGLDSKKKVLVIGTGEPAAMVAKTLKKKDIPFDVTSRSIERATGFTTLLSGNPVDFDTVLAGFDKYDIIFVATTSDYFLITYERIRLVMEEKKKGTLILDLSDPRTVDEGITALPGIKLLFRLQKSMKKVLKLE
jgi:glutamyl-tRNA reductase